MQEQSCLNIKYKFYQEERLMYHSPMTDIMKGVALGMMAGIAVGCCGRKMYDENPKLKKKAGKAIRTMESMLDTAQYMFR